MEISHIDRLGLGTWAFGGRAYGPMEDTEARRVVGRAYDLGIRFFDTAFIYGRGRSEEILGEALENKPDAIICTKLGYDPSSGKAVKRYDDAFLDQSLQTSLTRLRRSHIDILLLHNPPTDVLEAGTVFGWLEKMIRAGLIKEWGVSVYDSVRDAELSLKAGAKYIEARYSLLRRDVIDQLSKGSFKFIARSPLDGGLLSGKYTGGESFPATDQRSATQIDYIKLNAEFLKELQPLLDNGIASSFSELAIRFSGFGDRTWRVIPGAKAVQQLEAIVTAISKGPLPADALRVIDSVRPRYLRLIDPC